MEESKPIVEEVTDQKELEEVMKMTVTDDVYNSLEQLTVKLHEINTKIGFLSTEKFRLLIDYNNLADMKEKLVSQINRQFSLPEGSQWTIDTDSKELILDQ